MNLRRLHGITKAEMRWRASSAARTLAERASFIFGTRQWDRDAAEVPPARLIERMRSGGHTFLLDPRSAEAMRAEILARWPAAAADAAARADRVIAGTYDLLGYRDLSFTEAGRGIDWHYDPVHQRRSPVRFWADVPYLDPAVGDHKIIWELNRHQHWLTLGRALWLTGDPRYADAIVTQLESWMAANPPYAGTNWASMLEIGFRSVSWVWALHFLLAFDPRLSALDVTRPELGAPRPQPRGSAWLADMLAALDLQARHLESHLSYYFSPNTHLTGEALGLYVLGTALPELAGSGRWAATGRQVLLTEIDRQILPDGGHAERSTHYQRYTLDFYLMALLTARRAGDTDAARRFESAATRLAEFTRAIADDNGQLPLIGDDDGGAAWRLTGRACADVRDSLALAASLLDRPDLAPWGLTEEVFWLAGPTNASRGASLEGPPAPPPSRAFADTGYVVMRDGRGSHLVFDVGAHGYMNGGHAHADALALTLTLPQGPLLVDPGTATYTMSPDLRDRMRSSASHNTLTIDGRAQSDPAGPFHWRTRTDASLTAFLRESTFDAAEGWHDAYAPVRHTRHVVRVQNDGWLVVDELKGGGTHAATTHWHFDPRWRVVEDGPGRLRVTHETGQTVWLVHDADAVALVHGDDHAGAAQDASWFAPAYGTLVPTWTARMTSRGTAPRALVTWIDTSGSAEPARIERRSAGQIAAPINLRIHRENRTWDITLGDVHVHALEAREPLWVS